MSTPASVKPAIDYTQVNPKLIQKLLELTKNIVDLGIQANTSTKVAGYVIQTTTNPEAPIKIEIGRHNYHTKSVGQAATYYHEHSQVFNLEIDAAAKFKAIVATYCNHDGWHASSKNPANQLDPEKFPKLADIKFSNTSGLYELLTSAVKNLENRYYFQSTQHELESGIDTAFAFISAPARALAKGISVTASLGLAGLMLVLHKHRVED